MIDILECGPNEFPKNNFLNIYLKLVIYAKM